MKVNDADKGYAFRSKTILFNNVSSLQVWKIAVKIDMFKWKTYLLRKYIFAEEINIYWGIRVQWK